MRFNAPPPVTRALILLTCSSTFAYTAASWNARSKASTEDHSVPYITLVPSKALFYPWTVLTSTFVEQNVVNFLINTLAFYFSGRYLERVWGSKDFAIVAA